MRFKNIVPLSEFKKRSNPHLVDLEYGEEPLLITLHGKGAFVAQNIDAYLRLDELAEMARHHQALDETIRHMEERGAD